MWVGVSSMRCVVVSCVYHHFVNGAEYRPRLLPTLVRDDIDRKAENPFV